MNLQRMFYSAIVVLSLFTLNKAQAVDLDWSQTTGPLFFYDTAGNWTPAQTPTDADNVTFSIPVTPTPSIIIGATSTGLNVNIFNNDWIFTGASGANLDTEGTVIIDDALATALANGSNLTVNAAVNWDTVFDLIVGDAGYGTLNLDANADFRGRNVFIGNQLGSVGVVNVDGTGTTLQTDGLNSGDGFIIGNAGTGTLNVTGGGLARIVNDTTGGIADFNLGLTADGEGTLNIDGSGSSVIAEDVVIGSEGIGHVTITNGGVLNQNISTSPDAFVAQFAGSSGDVTVSGDGSEWRMARLEIGNLGDGTLSVEAGGFVRSNSNDMTLADAGGSGKVAVFGSGTNNSRLEVANNLFVGNLGLGELRIGQNLSGSANGNGELQVGSDLRIGEDGTNTADNLVVVSGANALANVDNATYVGLNGKGRLEVTDGAQFTGRFLRVGQFAGADGELLINGPNSLFDTDADTPDTTDDTVIGLRTTGLATVSNGGRLRTDQLWIGYDTDGDGTLIIDNGTVNAGVDNETSGSDVIIGGRTDGSGGMGSVTVQNGGIMTSAVQTVIGGNSTGVGSLTVTGLGSLFDNSDNGPGLASNDILRIGQAGGGTAMVLDGGRIEAEGILIGNANNNLAAALTVSGTNGSTPSTVETGGYLYVGNSRKGTMTVDQGAQVSVATNIGTERIFIGDDDSADGSKLTVTGAGSRVDYFGTGDVSVGNAGGSTADRAMLEVTDGGVFSAVQRNLDTSIASQASIVVGDATNGNGRILVKDPGSHVEAEAIYVGDGDSSSSGILDISNGGTATTTGELQAGSNGSGVGTVNVDGFGSLLDVGTSLALGDDVPGNGTATGNLNITEGGTVNNGGQAYIGHFNGSFGVATVGSSTANTSTWTIGGDLILAGTEGSAQSSGSGELNVNTGGLVDVGADLLIRNLGEVNLGGGELRVPGSVQFLGAGATMNFNSGTLRFSNGTGATLDSALLANIFNGGPQVLTTGKHLAVDGLGVISAPLRVNGGTLSVGNISVANMQNVDFDAGTFNLTDTGLIVTNAGLFGSTLVVDEDQNINVATSLFVQADGLLNVARGTVSAFSGVNSGTTVVAGGTITVDTNFVNNGDLVLVDGTLNGNLSNNGDLTVVNTAALSSLSLNSSGSASFGLDGSAGTADLLAVGGNALIGGTLNVAADNLSSFTLGQQFDLITASAVNGTFASESLPTLTGGLGFDVLYEATRVALAVVNVVTIDGDFDFDGDVDGRDFLVWQRGRSPNGLNSGDLALWQSQYDNGIPLATSRAVPEPTSLLLLLLGTLSALVSRSHHEF